MRYGLDSGPHRRFNPLLGEWVLVSPQRVKRPWQGQTERPDDQVLASYDSKCYLCPGNLRANGLVNPKYSETHVFENDFAAVLPQVEDVAGRQSTGKWLTAQAVQGECRVLCFSPHHNLTLAEMDESGLASIVQLWVDQSSELGSLYKWVQVFENKGAAMGCSNPHPHGQVWAGDWLPSIPAREEMLQRQWPGSNLLMDCLDEELEDGERVVVQNEHWVFLVPFWAAWPFEGLLVPKRHVQRLPDLTCGEVGSLAKILREVLSRYDNLFETSFPYSMGWHGAPFGPGDFGHWQLHAHVFPPLLRSASVRKFMVGYELLAEPQRDITPEQAAQRLRSVGSVHYRSA